MAYQFFAKAHQSSRASSASPPLSPPQHSSSSPPSHSAHVRPPKYPPSMVGPAPSSSSSPPSISLAAKFKPPISKDASLHPPAYPHAIAPGFATPHPHVTIEPVSTAHIPSLTRITGLLLPIRYPNSFYTATITDPVIASLSRVAIYHDHPVAAALASGASTSPSPASPAAPGTDKVIGGIRCRLERLSPTTAPAAEPSQNHNESQQHEPVNLYIQTLHLLSPYRGCGVAASLLNSLLFSSPPSPTTSSSSAQPFYQVSELVRHYNILTVTAHVHEANEEGLKWYISRGFQVEDGIVENYYRRLKPSGARIVKLALQWDNDGNDSEAEIHTQQAPPQPVPVAEKDLEDDDDWEKVEAEDEDDHDVQSFTDSRLIEIEDAGNRKRKADGEPQRS